MPDDFVALDFPRLEQLGARLRRAAQIEGLYTGPDPTWAGAPGSAADLDRHYLGYITDRSWLPRTINTTYAAARLGLIAMAEYALSLARLVTEPPPGLAGGLAVDVLCRSAVDTGSRAWWLMEYDISPLDRVSRHLADQLYSAHEAARLASRMRWDDGVSGISPTVADVTRVCDELGLPHDRNTGTPTVGGQTRPGSTSLASQFVGDTGYAESRHLVYSLTSASGHGTHFALMRAYQPSEDRFEGEMVLIRRVDHRVVEGTIGMMLSAFTAVVRRVVKLCGWGWTTIDAYQSGLEAFLRTGYS